VIVVGRTTGAAVGNGVGFCLRFLATFEGGGEKVVDRFLEIFIGGGRFGSAPGRGTCLIVCFVMFWE
jgi:hypothetical protein